MQKRFFDIIASFLGLILLSPLFIFIAILIKIDSKGSVFYIQERVGKDGRIFPLIKFRTMKTYSDSKGMLTIGKRDPRVTNSGYYLRKYKLDELPQLINVLKGDMSIVGPRPEVKKYVDMYDKRQRKVLSVPPGISDFASIEYRNENELLSQSQNPEELYITHVMPAKLELNLKYIEEKSFKTDLKIIFSTIKAVFLSK